MASTRARYDVASTSPNASLASPRSITNFHGFSSPWSGAATAASRIRRSSSASGAGSVSRPIDRRARIGVEDAHQPRSIHSWRWGARCRSWCRRRGRASRSCRAAGWNSRSSIDWMIVGKSAPSNVVLPGPAREQGVAAEQHRRALEPEAHRAGRVPGRGDRVEAQPADLDDAVVLEHEVVGRAACRRRRR